MTGTRAPHEALPSAALEAEVAQLRQRLEEAEDTLRAIRTGEVDALVISTPDGEQIYTLEGAETAYRVMVEAMSEGAMTLAEDGTILYCNRHLADMLEIPLDSLLGTSLRPYVADSDLELFDSLLVRGLARAVGAVGVAPRGARQLRCPQRVRPFPGGRPGLVGRVDHAATLGVGNR